MKEEILLRNCKETKVTQPEGGGMKGKIYKEGKKLINKPRNWEKFPFCNFLCV